MSDKGSTLVLLFKIFAVYRCVCMCVIVVIITIIVGIIAPVSRRESFLQMTVEHGNKFPADV